VELPIAEIVQNAHDFNPRGPMTPDLRPATLFLELEGEQLQFHLEGPRFLLVGRPSR
jgi:hypothetical protein